MKKLKMKTIYQCSVIVYSLVEFVPFTMFKRFL